MDEKAVQSVAERALGGDEEALAEAFAHYQPRLRRMILLRLDPRLHRRVDPSDVLQEAYIELAQQLPEFSRKRNLPFFLWLRLVTGRRLQQTHRRHLATAKRNAKLEVSIHGPGIPGASDVSLASRLVGSLTSPSEKAIREEAEAQVRALLESLDPLDREILALRHIEDLSNSEAALELGLKESTASMRHLRALERLGGAIEKVPGLILRP